MGVGWGEKERARERGKRDDKLITCFINHPSFFALVTFSAIVPGTPLIHTRTRTHARTHTHTHRPHKQKHQHISGGLSQSLTSLVGGDVYGQLLGGIRALVGDPVDCLLITAVNGQSYNRTSCSPQAAASRVRYTRCDRRGFRCR